MEWGDTLVFLACSLAFAASLWWSNKLTFWLRPAILTVLVVWMFVQASGSAVNDRIDVALTSFGIDREQLGDGRTDALLIGNHSDHADYVIRPVSERAVVKAAPASPATYVGIEAWPETQAGVITARLNLAAVPGDPATGYPAMITAYEPPPSPSWIGAIWHFVVRKVTGRTDRSFVGAIPLKDGAVIQPGQGRPAVTFSYKTPEAVLSDPWQAKGKAPKWLTFDKRVYRVRENPGLQSIFFLDYDGTWHLLPLVPGVSVSGAEPPVTADRDLPFGASERVHIYRLDLPDPVTRKRSPLVERRSFRIFNDVGRIRVRLDSPDRLTAGNCKDQPRHNMLTRVARPPEAFAGYIVPERVLTFSNLGNGRLTPEGADRPYSVMNRAGDGEVQGFDTVCAKGGLNLLRFDARTTATLPQSTAGDFALNLDLQRVSLPWPLLAFFLIGAFGPVVCSLNRWGRYRTESVLTALVSYFVCLRLLIGVRGMMMDPSLTAQEVFSDIPYAAMCLPLVFVALRPPSDFRIVPRLSLTLILLAASAWALWAGAGDAVGLLSLSLCVIPLIWPLLVSGWRYLTRRFFPGIRPAAAPVDDAARPGWSLWLRHPLTLAVGLVLVAAAARLLLKGLGIEERKFFSLSTPYLAMALSAFAFVLVYLGSRSTRRHHLTTLLGAGVLGVVALVAAAIPALVSDLGFVLVQLLPVLLYASFLVFWSWRTPSQSASWLLSSAVLPLLAGAGTLYVLYSHSVFLPAPEDSLDSLLHYTAAHGSRNDLRLLHHFSADRVADVGNRYAVENQQFWLELKQFTSHLAGRGYVTSGDLGMFSKGTASNALHLTDNLSAVHIMGPFGRLGAAGVLIVIASAAWLITRAAPPPAGTVPKMAGVLAMIVLAFSALYMILANLGFLLPFTGRNVYLLAATSGSDILESMMLLIIVWYGLARKEA